MEEKKNPTPKRKSVTETIEKVALKEKKNRHRISDCRN